jgi:hypothetical protein
MIIELPKITLCGASEVKWSISNAGELDDPFLLPGTYRKPDFSRKGLSEDAVSRFITRLRTYSFSSTAREEEKTLRVFERRRDVLANQGLDVGNQKLD